MRRACLNPAAPQALTHTVKSLRLFEQVLNPLGLTDLNFGYNERIQGLRFSTTEERLYDQANPSID